MIGDGRQPPNRLKRLEEFTLADLEFVRLILKGDSVIDWHRLNFETEIEVHEFLMAQELHPDDPTDATRMEAVKSEAIGFLRRQFEYPIPKPVERATVPELMLLAAGRGHRQTCACSILKCMHIIHHLDGRELLFMLPLSDQEVFHVVEEKVYRVIGSMLAGGFPIIEFVGGRKNKDSLYTKLLSKQETTAAQIYDKLRFRIVTRAPGDIFPVLQYLSKKLFPFNYVVPGQSINSMFNFRAYCQEQSHLRPMLGEMQGSHDDEFTPSDNTFSADTYRVLHFVVDMPVRLPKRLMERAPPAAAPFGGVIFVICEFQLVDRQTESSNELGDASHAKYKERQKKAVMRRLHLGTREMRVPPSSGRVSVAAQPRSAGASTSVPAFVGGAPPTSLAPLARAQPAPGRAPSSAPAAPTAPATPLFPAAPLGDVSANTAGKGVPRDAVPGPGRSEGANDRYPPPPLAPAGATRDRGGSSPPASAANSPFGGSSPWREISTESVETEFDPLRSPGDAPSQEPHEHEHDHDHDDTNRPTGVRTRLEGDADSAPETADARLRSTPQSAPPDKPEQLASNPQESDKNREKGLRAVTPLRPPTPRPTRATSPTGPSPGAPPRKKKT